MNVGWNECRVNDMGWNDTEPSLLMGQFEQKEIFMQQLIKKWD